MPAKRTATAATRARARDRRAEIEAISPSGLFDDVEPINARLLLLAAAAAFAERGYHATTTREIAGRLDLSPAAVYSHFPNKADLLFELCMKGNQYVRDMLVRVLDGVEDPRERINLIVRHSVVFHANEHIVTRAVNSNLSALEGRNRTTVVRLRREVSAIVRREIEAGVEAGVFTVPDVNGAAIALLRLVDVGGWYSDSGEFTPDQLAEIYAGLIDTMFGATTSTPVRRPARRRAAPTAHPAETNRTR